ncbi:MAG: ABC transporter substrate-binding protein, partial [Crenarchaeota archaeon]|nr:ABC transporter substrate-binding protein [Thermoproteota archaeon]
MKRNYLIISAVLIVLLVGVSIYGVFNIFANPSDPITSPQPSSTSSVTPSVSSLPTSSLSPSHSPTSTITSSPTLTPSSTSTPFSTSTPTPTSTVQPEPENKTVTIIDATGTQWTISAPVNRIVSLNAGLTEIVYALGGGEKIVGRSETSTFPNAVLSVPIVGGSSASPNVELLLETQPDLVLADTMLSSKTEIRNQITSAGVPILIVKTTYADQLTSLISDIGSLIDEEEKATELCEWMNHYINLVDERIANLTES